MLSALTLRALAFGLLTPKPYMKLIAFTHIYGTKASQFASHFIPATRLTRDLSEFYPSLRLAAYHLKFTLDVQFQYTRFAQESRDAIV